MFEAAYVVAAAMIAPSDQVALKRGVNVAVGRSLGWASSASRAELLTSENGMPKPSRHREARRYGRSNSHVAEDFPAVSLWIAMSGGLVMMGEWRLVWRLV